jgi:hypothetical protein
MRDRPFEADTAVKPAAEQPPAKPDPAKAD